MGLAYSPTNLGSFGGVNVTVNIPAPLSIWDNHPKKVTITQVIATLYIFAPTLDHSQPNRLGHKKTWIAAGWVNFVDQQKCSNKQLTSGTRLIDLIIQFQTVKNSWFWWFHAVSNSYHMKFGTLHAPQWLNSPGLWWICLRGQTSVVASTAMMVLAALWEKGW